MPQTLYPLWPRQQEAMQLLGLGGYANPYPVEELLFGGQAGGGKSYFLRALAVGVCLNFPNITFPIFRRTYPELEETHISKILSEMPADVFGRYNADRHEWRFPNKSKLEFRYCEREKDVYQYNSAEWDAMGIDEATQFSENQIRYLRSRIRSTKPHWRPFIVYTANPGGDGHHYFKNGFIDPEPAGTIFRAPVEDGGGLRAFLPARLSDNPALSADYKRKLAGISDPALRRALMEGDWDIFAGQVFEEFRRTSHVIDGFAIPHQWKRWRAIDYGYRAPSCCLWFAKDPDSKCVYVYKELYGSGLRDVILAERIRQMSVRERIDYTIADPALWNRNPNGTSVAQILTENGVTVTRGSNDRISGWQRVHDYLGGDPPRLRIFSSCKNLIRTLPALTYDEHRVEDVDSDGEDHAADTLRYGLMSDSVMRRMRVMTQDFAVVA